MRNSTFCRWCVPFLMATMAFGGRRLQAAENEVQSRFLMFDERLIENTQNALLRVEPAVKHDGNPLERWTHHVPWPMRTEYPTKHLIEGVEVPAWEEQTAIHYPNVIWDDDEQLFKMWYYSRMYDGPDLRRSAWLSHIEPQDAVGEVVSGRNLALCYMTSEDGLTWSRPQRDAFMYKGNPTNIVAMGNHGAGVFKDPHDPDPARRYKMFANRGRTGIRIWVAFSSNGIHWSEPQPAIRAKGDTHNNAFWAPDIQRYVGISREFDSSEGVRTVVRAESQDFVHWSDPEEILRGPRDAQVYTLLPMWYAPGYYIGLMSIIGQGGQVHTELAWSPDTRCWHRIGEGTPFIANAEAPDGYDRGMVYASVPIVRDDEIAIYYAGVVEPHVRTWRTTSLNLATIGRDRFAGYETDDWSRAGTVTTKPFQVVGNGLKITADVKEGGAIRVAVLDARGDPIPGFAFTDCDPVVDDVTDHLVTWSNKSLSQLPHRSVAFQFQLVRAKLFSISGRMIPPR